MKTLKIFSTGLAAITLACLGIYGAGTTVNGTRVINGDLTIKGTCTGCGSAPAFSSITSATNTTAAMLVGAGASLAPSSTGLLAANLFLPNSATGAPTAAIPLGGWTLQNTANAHGSYTDFSSEELVLTAGNFAALQWAGLTRTLSVPYTLYAYIQFRGDINGGVSAFYSTVCISDGTKYEFIGNVFAGATANVGIETATLATLSSAPSVLAGPTTGVSGPTLAVKLTNNSTTRTLQYWVNGAWTTLTSEAAGTFLTETSVGLCMLNDVGSGGYAPELALKYFQVQ